MRELVLRDGKEGVETPRRPSSAIQRRKLQTLASKPSFGCFHGINVASWARVPLDSNAARQSSKGNQNSSVRVL